MEILIISDFEKCDVSLVWTVNQWLNSLNRSLLKKPENRCYVSFILLYGLRKVITTMTWKSWSLTTELSSCEYILCVMKSPGVVSYTLRNWPKGVFQDFWDSYRGQRLFTALAT